MAKATTHPTCTPTNLNIRTRSSTLYANAPILLASILLNFRRRPESHLQLQVSEKPRARFRLGCRKFCRPAVGEPLAQGWPDRTVRCAVCVGSAGSRFAGARF